jgi:hypothetical protein
VVAERRACENPGNGNSASHQRGWGLFLRAGAQAAGVGGNRKRLLIGGLVTVTESLPVGRLRLGCLLSGGAGAGAGALDALLFGDPTAANVGLHQPIQLQIVIRLASAEAGAHNRYGDRPIARGVVFGLNVNGLVNMGNA